MMRYGMICPGLLLWAWVQMASAAGAEGPNVAVTGLRCVKLDYHATERVPLHAK